MPEFRMGDRVSCRRLSHKGFILMWDGPDAVIVRSEVHDQTVRDKRIQVSKLVREYQVTRPNPRGSLVFATKEGS